MLQCDKLVRLSLSLISTVLCYLERKEGENSLDLWSLYHKSLYNSNSGHSPRMFVTATRFHPSLIFDGKEVTRSLDFYPKPVFDLSCNDFYSCN